MSALPSSEGLIGLRVTADDIPRTFRVLAFASPTFTREDDLIALFDTIAESFAFT